MNNGTFSAVIENLSHPIPTGWIVPIGTNRFEIRLRGTKAVQAVEE